MPISSISGPSDISNPILQKISIILSLIIEIGCLEPKLIKFDGSVKSNESESSCFTDLILDFKLYFLNYNFLTHLLIIHKLFYPYFQLI